MDLVIAETFGFASPAADPDEYISNGDRDLFIVKYLLNGEW
jgi:hypothetical protein